MSSVAAQDLSASPQTSRPSEAKPGLLLVCVMADGQALELVRHALRVLKAVEQPWRVLYLDTVSARYASPAVRRDLAEALEQARTAGAQVMQASLSRNAGSELMAQIAQQAQGGGVSDLLLGDLATGNVYWPGFGERLSDFTALLRHRVPNVQIHILVARRANRRMPGPGLRAAGVPVTPERWSWQYWGLPLGALLLCTAICAVIAHVLHPINLILIYLVGVLHVALKRDLFASMATVLGAILIFDWIFVAPRWSLKPTDPEYFFTFAITLVVGLAVSRLAVRARAAAVSALALADRAQSLSLLAQSLSRARTPQDISQALLQAVEQGVGVKGRLLQGDAMPPDLPLYPTLPSADGGYRFALVASDGPLGVLQVDQLPVQRQTAEDLHLLQALSNQAALALDRCQADLRSQKAAIQAETERVRNTLLASISHDFRTPLTAIIGAATTVLTQGSQITPDQHEVLLRNLLDQARRLQSLTSDLLDLARLQDGAVQPECEWCPVGELVRDALALAQGGMDRRRIEIQASEDDIVWCDPRLVTQALTNLVSNAAQHSPPDGRIFVAVRLGAADWTLTVRDEGRGLAPGREAEVFRKFHREPPDPATRGPEQADAAGTGLGLAICEVVAQLHGGDIRACSDGGAVFEMRIPWPDNASRPMDLAE